MGILDRIGRLLKANINELISKAEDPKLIIEQALRDMREAYQDARNEVAEAMAQQSKIERERDMNRRQSEEYDGKARDALKMGREDLAREALNRKSTFEQVAAGFENQVAQNSSTIEELKNQLHALDQKISEMEAKKELLQARQQTAEATQKLEKVSGFDKAEGASAAFDEMEKRVAGMEDKSKAMSELRRGGDLDAQLAELGKKSEVEDALAKMKKEMGM